MKCVVADDHPAIVSAVVHFLDAEADIDVVGTAPNGVEAARLIEAREPEVALLDIRMPEPDGVQLARELAGRGSRTAVILFTGFPDRALLLEALDAGARGFLLKESPLPDLARAIRQVAHGGTYVDPMLSGILVGAGATAPLPSLTKREREILRLLADGMRNDAVAAALGISGPTVRTHIRHAMEKLEADTRTEAVATALRHALIA